MKCVRIAVPIADYNPLLLTAYRLLLPAYRLLITAHF